MLLMTPLLMQDAGQEARATKLTPVGSPQNWITDDDYPKGALSRGEFGTVRFTLVIDQTGKPTSCHVTATSGFVELDQMACAILLKRAKFSPARDAAGQPIQALFSSRFNWLLPGSPSAKQMVREPVPGIGLTLTLNKLPQGYQRPALLRVHFGRDGKPDACKTELSSGVSALDRLACQQAMAQARPPAETLKWNRRPDTIMVDVSFEAS